MSQLIVYFKPFRSAVASEGKWKHIENDFALGNMQQIVHNFTSSLDHVLSVLNLLQ